MASSLVSAPLQQSSQRSSPFPAYQAGPPLAASPPQPPPHAARPAASSAAAARADASPSIDSPRIEGPPGEASSSTRSGPSPAPARPVLASPTSTTTASGHASQGDSRELAVLAAKREKRRLRAVAKRERTRLAATVVDSGVPTPAPLSAVVQPPPAAVKAARTKAPAGTSVEVREVSRWSSSSSPAPPFDGLADGPAASLTAALQRFPSSSSSRSVPSSSSSPPPGMSASMTTTVGGELDNGPRTPPPPAPASLTQSAGGLVGELLDADELRRLRRKEKTARQKAAKKALSAAAATVAAVAPGSSGQPAPAVGPAASTTVQRPFAGAASSGPKPKPLPLKAKPTAAGAAFGPLHVSLPTQSSPRLASYSAPTSSSSSPPTSAVKLPMTGYRPEPVAPAAIAFAKQRFPSRKKAAAIVVRLPPARLTRTPAAISPSTPASLPDPDEQQVRLKPPVRRHSPSPLRIVSPKPVHQAPIALLRPPFLSSPSAAGSASSRAGSTASFQAGPSSGSAVGGEYALSFDGQPDVNDGGLDSFAVHPRLQQPHFVDPVGRYESHAPVHHPQQQPYPAFYLPPPPPMTPPMADWLQQHQHQASEPAYAYHPAIEYPGGYAPAPQGPYGAAGSSASRLPHHQPPPLPQLAYGPSFHTVAHPHHLAPYPSAHQQQQHPHAPQHANVLLPPGYTADGGVYWDPATGQPYLYAYPTPPASSAAPPPPPPPGPASLPVDGVLDGPDGSGAFLQQSAPTLPPFPPAHPAPTATLSQPLPLHLAQRPAFVPRQQASVQSPSTPPAPAFDPARALGAGGQVYYA